MPGVRQALGGGSWPTIDIGRGTVFRGTCSLSEGRHKYHKPTFGSGMEENRPRRLPDGNYCSSQAPQLLFLIEIPQK